MQTKKLLRRRSALERLKLQLESGVKNEKWTNESVTLTETDKTRISKEITILEKKGVSNR